MQDFSFPGQMEPPASPGWVPKPQRASVGYRDRFWSTGDEIPYFVAHDTRWALFPLENPLQFEVKVTDSSHKVQRICLQMDNGRLHKTSLQSAKLVETVIAIAKGFSNQNSFL